MCDIGVQRWVRKGRRDDHTLSRSIPTSGGGYNDAGARNDRH